MTVDVNDQNVGPGTRVVMNAAGTVVHVHSNGRLDVQWDGVESPRAENSVDARLLDLEPEEPEPPQWYATPWPGSKWHLIAEDRSTRSTTAYAAACRAVISSPKGQARPLLVSVERPRSVDLCPECAVAWTKRFD